MNVKLCRVCNKTKSISLFWKDKTHKDGYRTECICCEKKRVLAIKEEVLTYYGNGKLACVKCNFSR